MHPFYFDEKLHDTHSAFCHAKCQERAENRYKQIRTRNARLSSESPCFHHNKRTPLGVLFVMVDILHDSSSAFCHAKCQERAENRYKQVRTRNARLSSESPCFHHNKKDTLAYLLYHIRYQKATKPKQNIKNPRHMAGIF